MPRQTEWASRHTGFPRRRRPSDGTSGLRSGGKVAPLLVAPDVQKRIAMSTLMPESNHRTSSLADAPVRSKSARQSFSPDEAGRLATMFSPIARGVRSMRRRLRRVRDHRWTVTAVAVVVSAFLVFHFSLTGLYLLPLNPVKLTFGRYLSAYVDTLFTQNWHLFAPDPVNSSHSVIGKCRTGDVESAWLDVTHGIVERLKSNPVPGPLSSALHLQQTVIRAYLLGYSVTGCGTDFLQWK